MSHMRAGQSLAFGEDYRRESMNRAEIVWGKTKYGVRIIQKYVRVRGWMVYQMMGGH